MTASLHVDKGREERKDTRKRHYKCWECRV